MDNVGHLVGARLILVPIPACSWFDADTVLMNQNVPWHIFLPPSEFFSDIYFLGTKDHNGFNSGVFFIRVCEWTIQMLADTAALPSLRPDVQLGGNVEQDAMVWVFDRTGYREHVLYQPLFWYNGVEDPRDPPGITSGDVLVHFPGLSDKPTAMGKWLDRLENEKTKHELHIPLLNTTYVQRIEKYWGQLRSATETMQKVLNLKDDNYANITDASVIEKLEAAYQQLQQTTYDNAHVDELMNEGLSNLQNAIQVAEREKAATVKAIEDATLPEASLSTAVGEQQVKGRHTDPDIRR